MLYITPFSNCKWQVRVLENFHSSLCSGGNAKMMNLMAAEAAARRGLRALVLTRGYGGDEDMMLKERLRGVARVAAGSSPA